MTVQFGNDLYYEQKLKTKRKLNLVRSRINRLEASGLAELSPSYDYIKRSYGARFGVRGKGLEELQELEKVLDQFINKETSTITGMKKYTNDLAGILGVTVSNVGDAKKVQETFIKMKNEAMKVLKYCDMIDVHKYVNYREVMELLSSVIPNIKNNAEVTADELESALVDVVKMIEYDQVEAGGEAYYIGDTFKEYFPD